MNEERSLARLKPLFFGRLSRVLAGASALLAVPFVGFEGLEVIGAVALVGLGLSFLIGGLMANPGCEITALPNLFLRLDKRVHCL
ncbi:MAG: hypothetical protein OES47_13020 [Acidobacteriota bacterium]|nr:hypothetical protein [Acidobacteriota bacterium]